MSGLHAGMAGRASLAAGLLLLSLGFLTAFFYPARREPTVPVALAAPHAFAGPVNGGCYQWTNQFCSLRVDSWGPLVVDPNVVIDGFRLEAEREGVPGFTVLYDFATDVSNPPRTTYHPSPVRRDFGAHCDFTYTLRVLVSVEGDDGYVETGRTNRFTCPATVLPDGWLYVPVVIR